MYLSVHGEVQASHARGYEAIATHSTSSASYSQIALAAACIRHYQTNHEERGGKKRVRLSKHYLAAIKITSTTA